MEENVSPRVPSTYDVPWLFGIRKRTWLGFISCIGGFLTELTIGNIFSFGNLTTYLTSYIHKRVDPSIDYSDTVWISSLLLGCQGTFMVIGGELHRRYGARVATGVGCFLSSISVALTYWTIQTSFALTVISYGVAGGIGVSIGYAPPLYAGPKWFPRNTGLASGLVISGFGLGALVFDQVQTAFINPTNAKVDDDGYFSDPVILDRIPYVFLLLGGIFIAMQIVGLILIMDAPTDLAYDLEENGERQAQTLDRSISQRSLIHGPGTNLTWKEVLRTRHFYFFWFSMGSLNVICSFFQGCYKTFGQTFIKDDQFLATIGSLSSAFNACARLGWGYLYDRSSYRFTMMIVSGSLAVLTGTLALAPDVGDGKAFYGLWIILTYFNFAGIFSIMPSAVVHTFGPQHSTLNFGCVFSHTLIAGPLTGLFINVVEVSLGWTIQLELIALFGVLAFVLVLFHPSEFVLPPCCRCRENTEKLPITSK